jgi:hypothetical protein
MELRFPGNIYWKKMAREALLSVKEWDFYNEKFQPMGKFIGDVNNGVDIDVELVKAKQWLFVQNKKEGGKTYIGESLWTCNCKDDFIRSKLHLFCEKCGTNAVFSPKRLPYISEILQWESFIVNCEE